MAVRSALASILDALERYYGPVAPPPAQGPFELILWENVAYLASDEWRECAFARASLRGRTSPQGRSG